jgi:hypothetical protein
MMPEHSADETQNLPAQRVNAAPLLSSREIAEICEKQHQHVKRDIEAMGLDLGIDVSSFGRIYLDQRNREQTEYVLPKREALILCSGYSIELRARLVDRVDALERRIALPNSGDVGPSPALVREARLQFKMFAGIAKSLGLSGNQRALSANRATKVNTGVDMMAAMGLSHLLAPQNEALVIPKQIADAVGLSSASKANDALEEMGCQFWSRDHNGTKVWHVTPKGEGMGGTMVDVSRAHDQVGTARQLKWASGIIERVRGHLASKAVP